MHKHSLFSLDISLGRYGDFLDDIVTLALRNECSEYVCVANVHMLVEAYGNNSFAKTVNEAAIVTPDGMPLTWALRWLFGIKQERVAGMDLLPDLLSLASRRTMPVYFYGGTEDTMRQTKKYILERYPAIPFVGTCSPPFRPLTDDENEKTISEINRSGAKIVFVSLGCPKQERWMASMRGRVNAVMIGIGAALPVLTGIQKRAPKWMQKAGLEWFYRLMQEPERLWKRYLVTNCIFIYLILREKIIKLLHYKP
ncbi:MAG: WecB/TagA/CpsF family glycosyltransferase [Bacteroidales bacterium]|nr:WecB/TagA/CpsF family glycosyltransferase [Bacteroidales bacterium]